MNAISGAKKDGTFDQLLVTAFRPAEIMVGKALASLLVGLSQFTVVLLVAQLCFRLPFAGSFVPLYAGLTLFLLAACGIWLPLSSLVARMQRALLVSFMVAMPFTLLSGLFTSLSSMPEVLQCFSMVNPFKYMIDISRRVYLEGVGFDRLTFDLRPLF